MGHEITFFPAGDHHVWYGLAGVDVEAKPGSYKLALEATLPDGTVDSRCSRPSSSSARHYKTEN